jgi:serine protease Do
MLVLLSVHPAAPLPVAEVSPLEETRVGQWAIAVGRTLSAEGPNMSVGIVSALDRVWGRAIQTDAKISPTNYGGPLVDISGRVLGLLVPLSPDSTGALAGVEWYDSGIGFAVPLANINSVLPRLAAGNDLYPGLLGVGMKAGDPYSQPAAIAACRPHSPAAAAGLKAGDTVVEINGKPIVRQAQFKQELHRHYAGDRVRLVVSRSGERLEREIELAEKIIPYEFPFAGLLPMRPVDGKPAELRVRYVYPDSPAARAGVQVGDRIVSLGGDAVETATAAGEKLRSHEPGEKLAVVLEREGQPMTVEIELARLPEDIPGELPAAHAAVEAPAAAVAVGAVKLELPESKAKCLAYVPNNYRLGLKYGVVVWLRGGEEEEKDEELIARWRAQCEAHDLIVLAPKPPAGRWQPSDVRVIGEALDVLAKTHAIDPARTIVHGYETGGSLGYLFAFTQPGAVSGVAAVASPLTPRLPLPDNDPENRLAVYSAASGSESLRAAIDAGLARIKAAKFPLTVRNLGNTQRYLNADELAELVRWIDTLDRF